MEWELTRGLQNLRTQVNKRWPHRDHASDGTIGDAAHAAGVSGHNPDDLPYDNAEWDGDPDNIPEVRAWDMDSDLGEAGTSAQMVVDHIRALSNVSSVLRYIIYNRKIYRAPNGWIAQAYSGPSPHTEHIHFSGAWSQASDNNATFNFKLEEVNMPSIDDIRKVVREEVIGVLRDGYEAATGKASSGSAEDKGERNIRDYLRGIVGGPTEDDIARLAVTLNEIKALVTPVVKKN